MRVSDLGLQNILLQGFQQIQAGAEARQIQLSSGDRFQTYGEYGADALRLISAEGVLARATAFENAGQIALSRLETQTASLETASAAVADLRAGVSRTLATGSAELLIPDLEVAAQRIVSALNVSAGGVFVFGGTDGAEPPVAARTLQDIGAASSIDALFNEGQRARLAVEEGVFVDGGPVASDVAQDLFAALRDFANAEAALGPFEGEPTAAQRDFLIDAAARLGAVADDLVQEQGLLAASQGQADDAVDRNQRRRDLAEIVASEIESVDIAEVVSRLNQDQIALQASARALAQASELSLLNFI